MKKYDRSVFAWDIACFMDEVGLEKASVMGHSMGSFNAQAFAMDYPEKVDKLILESTSMIGTNSENPDDSYNIYDPDSPTFEGVTWDYIEWWYYNTILCRKCSIRWPCTNATAIPGNLAGTVPRRLPGSSAEKCRH